MTTKNKKNEMEQKMSDWSTTRYRALATDILGDSQDMQSVRSTWKEDHDDTGTISVELTCNNTTTGKYSHHVLTREMLLNDLSDLQTSWDKQNIDDAGQFSPDHPPPVGFRSKAGIWVALNHNLFRNATASTNDTILTILEPKLWEIERLQFEGLGCTVAPLDGAHHHTLYVKLERGGAVSHFSDVEVAGSEAMDCYHYTVNHVDRTADEVVRLLPYFLTHTHLMDNHICYVYTHIVPRKEYNPYRCPGDLHWCAAALVVRPVVFRDFRQFPTDEGRRRVERRDHRSSNVEEWEFQSAQHVMRMPGAAANLLQHIRTRRKNERRRCLSFWQPIIDFICSEEGRNRIQDAVQYAFPTHPAHFPECSFQRYDEKEQQQIMLFVASCLVLEDNDIVSAKAKQMSVQRRQHYEKLHNAIEEEAKRAEAEAGQIRRRLILEQRNSRAEKPEDPFTPRGGMRSVARDKVRGSKNETMENRLKHEVHTNRGQKEIREKAFDARQLLAHAEAVAKKAKERLRDTKRILATISSQDEAACHKVPPMPTVFDVMTSMFRDKQISDRK